MRDDLRYILVYTHTYSICGWFKTVADAQSAIGFPHHASKHGKYKIYDTIEVARGQSSVTWETTNG
jgi:hypothetical protein